MQHLLGKRINSHMEKKFLADLSNFIILFFPCLFVYMFIGQKKEGNYSKGSSFSSSGVIVLNSGSLILAQAR